MLLVKVWYHISNFKMNLDPEGGFIFHFSKEHLNSWQISLTLRNHSSLNLSNCVWTRIFVNANTLSLK